MLPTIASIQRAVADHYHVPLAWMREPDAVGTRLRSHVYPRQTAMRLASLLTDHSYPRIGHFFGGRDHATVIEACRRIDKRRATDPGLSTDMRRITLQLLRDGQ